MLASASIKLVRPNMTSPAIAVAFIDYLNVAEWTSCRRWPNLIEY